MNRRRSQDLRALNELRISRGYFPSSSPSGVDVMTGHSFLFIRDLPLGIMPMGHGIDKKSWSVSLEPTGAPDLTEWIATLLDVGRYGRPGLPSALSAFIQEITRELAYNGETYYEIVTEGSGIPTPAHLLSLPFGRVRKRRDVFLQRVPDADRDPGEPSEIEIPAANILRLTLPAELGTPDEHRALLKELVKLSTSMPKFALESPELGKDSGYDFAAHHHAQEVAIERAMAKWGTVPSVRRLKGTTEYFFVVRTLQFARSQALIREHLVGELNLLLGRLGVERTVVVSGLPTADAIGVAMDALERGEMDFKAAMEVVEM
jgi:hypothetical protein